MKIFEIKLSFSLKKDFHFLDYPNFISQNINKILYNSIMFRSMHIIKGYKPYVVGSLTPFEKDKLYKKSKNYTLTIRTIDDGFVFEFIKASKTAYNLDFQITQVTHKLLKIGFIDKVYTITPAIITVSQNHYWTIEDDFNILQNNIKSNLQKKYFEFFRRNIDEPQINYFEVKNRKPIVFNYKQGKLFSNKFMIGFAEDEVSQKLAKLAFGIGILEKNSLGFGMLVRGRE